MGQVSPEYVYIQTAEQLSSLKSAISQARFIGIDVETTGLNPFEHKIRLIQIAISESLVFLIDLFKFPELNLLPDLLQNNAVKIFHNGKFDLKFLKTAGLGVDGPFFDTMLAYQVLTAGEYKQASLEEVCFEVLKIEISKEEQTSNWSNPNLTRSQLEYAAKDASILLKLHRILQEELLNAKLYAVATLEFGAIEPTVEIELNGMCLDSDKLEKLKSEATAKLDALRSELRSELNDPDINLVSPKQVKERLIAMGIEVSSTSKSTLIPLVSKYPILAKILAYRKEFKLLTSFLESMKCHVHPKTGRIHPTLWQIGCVTGRYSCSNPNLQQIPRESAVRECFIAPPGKKLVLGDFSQIELRVVAELTGDERMVSAFKASEDLHALTASLVCQKDISQVTAEERTKAKAINFGLTFGMSVFSLKNYTLLNYGLEMSWWQAWRFHDRFFEGYKRLKEWHEREKDIMAFESFTLSGRRRLFPEEAWFTARLNTPVQGTAADIMKKSLVILFEKLKGTESKIIGTVHDEVLVECKESVVEEVAKVLEDSMKNGGQTYLKTVPVEVEIKTGQHWGVK